jgi:hypothetical protein
MSEEVCVCACVRVCEHVCECVSDTYQAYTSLSAAVSEGQDTIGREEAVLGSARAVA